MPFCYFLMTLILSYTWNRYSWMKCIFIIIIYLKVFLFSIIYHIARIFYRDIIIQQAFLINILDRDYSIAILNLSYKVIWESALWREEWSSWSIPTICSLSWIIELSPRAKDVITIPLNHDLRVISKWIFYLLNSIEYLLLLNKITV